jgi:hypothetical protein
MGQLVNNDDLHIVREYHGAKYKRCYCLQCIHVASSKKDSVIQLGIYNFNVNEEFLFPPILRAHFDDATMDDDVSNPHRSLEGI